MPDRHDFNLDELLGEHYVRHYQRFLKGAGNQFYVAPDPLTEDLAWSAHADRPDDEDRPYGGLRHEGFGPDLASSCTGLEPYPAWCWDVCGYYRRLHVSWRATRVQLARSYLRHGGPLHRRMTYALKQLMQPKIRRLYDLATPARPFLPDQETQERLKAAAVRAAAQRAAQGGTETADEVLEDWGYRSGAPGPDDGTEAPVAASRHEVLGSSRTIGWTDQWSWYEEGECGQPPPWLADWQALLVQAFSEAGVHAHFAIGFTSDPDPKVLALPSEGRRTILLGTRPPTLALAIRAVHEWQAGHRRGESHGSVRHWRSSS